MTPAELRAKGFRLVRNGNLRPYWSREAANEVRKYQRDYDRNKKRSGRYDPRRNHHRKEP